LKSIAADKNKLVNVIEFLFDPLESKRFIGARSHFDCLSIVQQHSRGANLSHKDIQGSQKREGRQFGIRKIVNPSFGKPY
jgi:hypothetical protein